LNSLTCSPSPCTRAQHGPSIDFYERILVRATAPAAYHVADARTPYGSCRPGSCNPERSQTKPCLTRQFTLATSSAHPSEQPRSIMTGDLPPSSSVTRDQIIACRAHDCTTDGRTAREKKVVKWQTREFDGMHSYHTSRRQPGRSRAKTSPRTDSIKADVWGVSSDGLIMARLPAARAVASGMSARATG
jgi:hypothetical protein